MSKSYWVYMLASHKNSTLYIGVTNNLSHRVFEHKMGRGSVFTRKYAVKRLVWYEEYSDINEAIEQETRMKRWERAWKIKRIEEVNPNWNNLHEMLNA